ncbi:WD repeat-containing protein wdr-5.1 [Diplonema papillatum]|nr:WD repeat-containing protein wdr-5.1 [Diplonema papillatum]
MASSGLWLEENLESLRKAFGGGDVARAEFLRRERRCRGADAAAWGAWNTELDSCFEWGDTDCSGRVPWSDITDSLTRTAVDPAQKVRSWLGLRLSPASLAPPPAVMCLTKPVFHLPGLGLLTRTNPNSGIGDSWGSMIVDPFNQWNIQAYIPTRRIADAAYMQRRGLLAIASEELSLVFFDTTRLSYPTPSKLSTGRLDCYSLSRPAAAGQDERADPPPNVFVHPQILERRKILKRGAAGGRGAAAAPEAVDRFFAPCTFPVKAAVPTLSTHGVLAADRSGSLLASGDKLGRVYVWSLAGGKGTHPGFSSGAGHSHHKDIVSAIAFGGAGCASSPVCSGDGGEPPCPPPPSHLFSGSYDCTVASHDLAKQQFARLAMAPERVACLEWVDRFKLVLVGGFRGSVFAYSLDTPRSPPFSLQDPVNPHTSAVTAVKNPRSSYELVTADGTGLIKLWDLRTLQCVQSLFTLFDARHGYQVPGTGQPGLGGDGGSTGERGGNDALVLGTPSFAASRVRTTHPGGAGRAGGKDAGGGAGGAGGNDPPKCVLVPVVPSLSGLVIEEAALPPGLREPGDSDQCPPCIAASVLAVGTTIVAYRQAARTIRKAADEEPIKGALFHASTVTILTWTARSLRTWHAPTGLCLTLGINPFDTLLEPDEEITCVAADDGWGVPSKWCLVGTSRATVKKVHVLFHTLLDGCAGLVGVPSCVSYVHSKQWVLVGTFNGFVAALHNFELIAAVNVKPSPQAFPARVDPPSPKGSLAAFAVEDPDAVVCWADGVVPTGLTVAFARRFAVICLASRQCTVVPLRFADAQFAVTCVQPLSPLPLMAVASTVGDISFWTICKRSRMTARWPPTMLGGGERVAVMAYSEALCILYCGDETGKLAGFSTAAIVRLVSPGDSPLAHVGNTRDPMASITAIRVVTHNDVVLVCSNQSVSLWSGTLVLLGFLSLNRTRAPPSCAWPPEGLPGAPAAPFAGGTSPHGSDDSRYEFPVQLEPQATCGAADPTGKAVQVIVPPVADVPEVRGYVRLRCAERNESVLEEVRRGLLGDCNGAPSRRMAAVMMKVLGRDQHLAGSVMQEVFRCAGWYPERRGKRSRKSPLLRGARRSSLSSRASRTSRGRRSQASASSRGSDVNPALVIDTLPSPASDTCTTTLLPAAHARKDSHWQVEAKRRAAHERRKHAVAGLSRGCTPTAAPGVAEPVELGDAGCRVARGFGWKRAAEPSAQALDNVISLRPTKFKTVEDDAFHRLTVRRARAVQRKPLGYDKRSRDPRKPRAQDTDATALAPRAPEPPAADARRPKRPASANPRRRAPASGLQGPPPRCYLLEEACGLVSIPDTAALRRPPPRMWDKRL